jgi:hypothetical protein
MKTKSIPLLLFIMIPFLPCRGYDLPDQKEDAAHSIMVQIGRCQFDQAQLAIDSMVASDTADPLGWMLLLAEISLRQLDYAHSSDSDAFPKTYERAKTVMAVYEKQQGADSYLLTIKGISQLIATAYTMNRKKYFSAMRMGFDAIDLCKEAKKIDSGNVDADFVIGLYNYGRAELKRKFHGILFWYSGDKLSGIRSIERCGQQARLISLVADMVLQEIYVKERMFDKASSGINRLLALYPDNRFVLWTKSKFFDERKMPAAAAEIYGKLADDYERIPAARKNFTVTRLFEAKRYFEAKNIVKAQEACDRLLSNCKGMKEDDCEEAEGLAKKINDEMKKQ